MPEFLKLGCARKRILSTVSCAAMVIVFILVDGFVYNVSLYSTAFETKKSSVQFLSNIGDAGEPLQLELNFGKTIDQTDSRPPINVTEDRIAWLQTLLPACEIFKSMRPTQQYFEDRVRRFFICDCEVRFFMTWISPAESFGRREFIAMDSLFKAHPRGCLMILSTTMDSRVGDRLLEPLRDRGSG